MDTQESKHHGPLENGQLWKIEHGYLHVLELGGKFIRYKMLQEPDQKDAVIKMIGLEALVNYLRYSDAELMSGSRGQAASRV